MTGAAKASLASLAAQAEAEAFQGRIAELGSFAGLLGAPETLPRILAVYGQTGVGKSAFLRACRRLSSDRGLGSMVIVDGREFRHDLTSLGSVVRDRGGPWPPGADGCPAALALDNFDELSDMLASFEDFLADLDGPALIVLAGRRRPAGLQRSSIGELLTEMQLGPLTEWEAESVLAHHGVDEQRIRAHALRLGAGNPLLLTMLAQAARGPGLAELTAGEVGGEVSRVLVSRIAWEVAGPSLIEALEAAAQVKAVDEDLLSAMLGRPARDDFEALCRLSFVTLGRRGAALHDLVRLAVASELQWRRPSRAQQLRRGAYIYLRGLAEQRPSDDGPAAELLFLAGTTLLQATVLGPADDDIHVDEATDADWPIIEELLCAAAGAGTLTEPLGSALDNKRRQFAVARRGFRIAREDDGQALGFYNYLPLNRTTMAACADDLRPFLRYASADELTEYWRASSDGPPPGVVIDSVVLRPGHQRLFAMLRDNFLHFRRINTKRVITAAWRGGQTARLAEDMGWELAGPFLNKVHGSVADADVYVQRFWAQGFDSYIERLLGIPATRPYTDTVSQHELRRHVKEALEHLYDVRTLADSPLIQLRCTDQATDRTGDLRRILIAGIGELEREPQRAAQQAGALLRDIYIRRLGSQEVVAERLGLPRTTFYRRLHLGWDRLATWLRVSESAAASVR